MAICLLLVEFESFPSDELLSPTRFGDRLPTAARAITLAAATIGQLPVALVTVALLTLAVSARLGVRHGALVLLAAFAVVVNELLRTLIGPTPAELRDYPPGEPNFPSGHVVYVSSLLGLMAWLAWTQGCRRSGVAVCLVIAAIGPLRILKGAHWPSDVVAGYALGFAWLLIVLVVTLPWVARLPRASSAPD